MANALISHCGLPHTFYEFKYFCTDESLSYKQMMKWFDIVHFWLIFFKKWQFQWIKLLFARTKEESIARKIYFLIYENLLTSYISQNLVILMALNVVKSIFSKIRLLTSWIRGWLNYTWTAFCTKRLSKNKLF